MFKTTATGPHNCPSQNVAWAMHGWDTDASWRHIPSECRPSHLKGSLRCCKEEFPEKMYGCQDDPGQIIIIPKHELREVLGAVMRSAPVFGGSRVKRGDLGVLETWGGFPY